MTVLNDDDEPLWKRIFLNEFLLATAAAVIVLYLAFTLATRRDAVDEAGRPIPPASRAP
ncbi:MAG: hypothetical protein HY716_08855 [Planctomycetes bacterium]|nr:hypothetical protein [Planctomycetota bacterium]